MEQEGYSEDYKSYITDGYKLTECQSLRCPVIDGKSYKFDFKGNIWQDGVPRDFWTVENQVYYKIARQRLLAEC